MAIFKEMSGEHQVECVCWGDCQGPAPEGWGRRRHWLAFAGELGFEGEPIGRWHRMNKRDLGQCILGGSLKALWVVK